MRSTRREKADSQGTVGVSRRDLMRGMAIGVGAMGAGIFSDSRAASAEAATSAAAEQHEFIEKMASFEKTSRGAIFHCTTSQGKSVEVAVSVCTPEIIRVEMCPDEQLKDVKCLLEIKEDWPAAAFDLSETAQEVVIATGAVRLRVQRDPWKYSLHDSRPEPVLQENEYDVEVTGDCRSLPIGFTTQDGEFRRSNETFYLAPGEHIYGLGEQFARLDKLGETTDGWLTDAWGSGTKDIYKHIPFLISTRGYGVYFNTTFRLHGYIGSQSFMAYTVMIDHPRLDFFLIYGPRLKQVLARFLEISGMPALPPKESFGIWHSPKRPSSGSPYEVESYVAVGKKFREMDIPVDIFLMIPLSNRDHTADREQLAFTKSASEELAKIGIKTGIYTAPMLAMESQMEQEGRANNYVLTRTDGSPYPAMLINKLGVDFGKRRDCTLEAVTRSDKWRASVLETTRVPCLLPDFTNPDAVKWWKGKIADRIKAGSYGIAMSDFGEEIPVDAVFHNGRSGLEMHNLYALLYRKASFEAVAESSGHRGLINARSGTTGMQRFPICWSGDPNCSWQDMANTMRAGLSIALSGVAFWSCDNAGFDDEHGHLTPELWIRWSQWSMFISHVRLHGMGPVRAPWSFGDLAVENFRKYAKLRYRLLPYIYSHAYNASQTGLPMMRPMVLEFEDDSNTYTMEDQYMFGDAFLVAPVYTPANQRTVYLPKGRWIDYEAGKEFTGPTLLHIEPPLEQLPLFVKTDSIIPMGPDMAYVGERPFDPITLDIRVSSQAEFTLYDDDERAGTQEIVHCRVMKGAAGISLELSGSRKTYIAKFNGEDNPASVTLDGAVVPRLDSVVELEQAMLGWYFDSSRTVYAKFKLAGEGKKLTLAYAKPRHA